jgi:phosphoribosylglycinamide formyltransferase-1
MDTAMGDHGTLQVGVLISGRGSNMVSIAEACAAEDFPADVCVLISNNPNAAGLERAASMGIATAVVDHHGFETKADFELQIQEVLEKHGAELVCLAGFMRVLSSDFCETYEGRLLNIHPALLPSFPGLNVQQAAIDYGVKFSGCTVHFVTAEVDAGPIVLQAVVPIEQDDTEETLAARILEQEHVIYPEAVRLYGERRIELEGRRVLISAPRA